MISFHFLFFCCRGRHGWNFTQPDKETEEEADTHIADKVDILDKEMADKVVGVMNTPYEADKEAADKDMAGKCKE